MVADASRYGESRWITGRDGSAATHINCVHASTPYSLEQKPFEPTIRV
jgi:hypothetical protein